MPKARRSSYNMAFKLKVVAEAEAVENNSEIAREYGLSPWSAAGERIRPNYSTANIEDVGEAYNHGSLHSEVSRAGPADTGVVYRTERTR